jgi:tetratricopeptide (TPR) repeat protein
MLIRSAALALVAVIGLQSPVAYSSDDTARGLLEKATDLYKDREKAGKLDEAITLLEKALQEASDSDLKFDILILHSRSIYYQGVHATAEAKKLELFEKGISLADSAKALNDEYAEGYYYHALSLGRWAETKGVMESLKRKQELLDHLNGSTARITRPDESGEFQAGESIDGHGPDRILGRIFFKLPGFAGGSREKSLSHLRRAVARAPQLALNHVYLAETLASEKKDREEAKSILTKLLANDPKTFNPSRTPETIEEFELGRKALAEIGR